MNAPIEKKPLPIRVSWLGPPEARVMTSIRDRLMHEGVEVEHRGYINGIDKLSKGTQAVLVMDGAVRGSLLRKVKDIAQAAGVPVIPVSGNAKIARQRLRDAGIVPPTEPAPAPTPPPPLRAPMLELARAHEPAPAPTPPPRDQQPLPSFVIPNDQGPKKGCMIERRYRLLTFVIAALSGGPAWLAELREAIKDSGVLDGRHLPSTTIDVLHWLRDAGMAEVIGSGKTKEGGNTYRWSLTSAPHDDAAIARVLANRQNDGREAQREAARNRAAPSAVVSALDDAPTLGGEALVSPTLRPWHVPYDKRLDAWCDPKGRKAVRK